MFIQLHCGTLLGLTKIHWASDLVKRAKLSTVSVFTKLEVSIFVCSLIKGGVHDKDLASDPDLNQESLK